MQGSIVILHHKGGTGDVDVVRLHAQRLDFFRAGQVMRLVHVGGVVYHIAHLLQDFYIFHLKFPEKVTGCRQD